ncbi:MAG TPA: membrane dipeptidase [Chthoniobacteraceae bacterium]|nr:membrane dipeptidase [Chthoniobacteraceae bacterium]
MITDLLTEPCRSIDPAFVKAWQRGLDVLQPTPSELKHGQELHRSLTICEHYGFLPEIWSERAVASYLSAGDGLSYVDFQRQQSYLRTADFAQSPETREAFLAALRQAGVHGLVLPVNDYGESIADAMVRIAAYRHLCLEFSDALFQTTKTDDIEQARRDGSTALIFSLSGLPLFGAGEMTDPGALLDWVEIWYGMGVRFMHVGYNRRNVFADGCGERNDGGLSELGRDLVAKMNEVGMIVDVPHSSRRTLLEAVEISTRPVIASHIGCQAVFDGARCKSDEEIKAIASTGGYVGIYSIPSFLGDHADLNQMLRHVEHAIRVVGPEHVVISTDLGHKTEPPQPLPRVRGGWRRRMAAGRNPFKAEGKDSAEHFGGSLAWTNRPLITVGLVKMGLRDDEIAKIHYGNLRRVLG